MYGRLFMASSRRWSATTFGVSAFVGGLLLASVAISHAAGRPRVTDAVLGEDRKDLAGSYEIVRPTTVFSSDSPKIVCVFKVEGASIGATTKAVWIAEDVGNKAPPNYKVAEKSLALPFLNYGSFSLSKPNSGWPVGSYRLEIYLGSTLAKTVKFTVRGAP
jgi:hypothetical protein